MVSRRWRAAWSLALVACLLVSGLALANSDGALAEDEEEGRPSWSLRLTRWMERARLRLAFSDEAQARLMVRFAEARMAKAEKLAGKGDYQGMGIMVREYARLIQEARGRLERAVERGKDVEALAGTLENAASRAEQVLAGVAQALLDKFGEKGAPGLQNAAQAVQKAQNLTQQAAQQAEEMVKGLGVGRGKQGR